MIKEYRKKPVVVDVMRFTDATKDRVFNWVTCNKTTEFINGRPVLKIETLEGVMTAELGDYVIKGVQGEFYPCKSDVFKETYQELGVEIDG